MNFSLRLNSFQSVNNAKENVYCNINLLKQLKGEIVTLSILFIFHIFE